MGFPFNISATAEASDIKFGTQLGVDEGHYKITPREKSGRGLGLGKLSKILGFPFNICETAENSDFKIGNLVGFAKAHRKILPRKKRAWTCAREAPKLLGFSL